MGVLGASQHCPIVVFEPAEPFEVVVRVLGREVAEEVVAVDLVLEK